MPPIENPVAVRNNNNNNNNNNISSQINYTLSSSICFIVFYKLKISHDRHVCNYTPRKGISIRCVGMTVVTPYHSPASNTSLVIFMKLRSGEYFHVIRFYKNYLNQSCLRLEVMLPYAISRYKIVSRSQLPRSHLLGFYCRLQEIKLWWGNLESCKRETAFLEYSFSFKSERRRQVHI
jgi:hypothetical protein